MKTRNGIYNDIKESTYKLKRGNYEFTFSSELYKNKFMTGLNEFIKVENEKINNKYKMVGDFSEYLSVIYYKRIEKRGFYVTYNNKELNSSSFILGDEYGD